MIHHCKLCSDSLINTIVLYRRDVSANSSQNLDNMEYYNSQKRPTRAVSQPTRAAWTVLAIAMYVGTTTAVCDYGGNYDSDTTMYQCIGGNETALPVFNPDTTSM